MTNKTVAEHFVSLTESTHQLPIHSELKPPSGWTGDRSPKKELTTWVACFFSSTNTPFAMTRNHRWHGEPQTDNDESTSGTLNRYRRIHKDCLFSEHIPYTAPEPPSNLFATPKFCGTHNRSEKHQQKENDRSCTSCAFGRNSDAASSLPPTRSHVTGAKNRETAQTQGPRLKHNVVQHGAFEQSPQMNALSCNQKRSLLQPHRIIVVTEASFTF